MSLTTIRSFLPIEKLGEGSFASVYKVQRISDRKIYALKKVQPL
jgi:NIMA (never in mitosis gene a)-related kinase